MTKTTRYVGLAALLFFLSAATTINPFGSRKAAYRSHYTGTLHYAEGRYQQAVSDFQRAYSIIPENYNFALSLALGLSRVGKAEEGLAVLRKGAGMLSKADPEYAQKLVFRYFFEGMALCYDGRFGQAISSLKKSIELQEPLGDPGMLSVFQSALGYAILLDQGKGADKRADLPPHYHVHTRDLVRARELFEKALDNDASNPSALFNYKMLSDTMKLPLRTDFADRHGKRNKLEIASGNVPANAMRLLEFAEYDEVVFLLDISGSMVMEKVICMGTTRFQVMKETAMFMVGQIPPATQLGIGTIGGDCGTVPRLWHATGKLSRKDLRQALEFLAPDGTTPLLTILKSSTELFSDNANTRKSIFLVSDGANVCRTGDIDICEWAEGLRSQQITINILTFLNADLSQSDAFAEYSCLAQNTGGRIEYVDIYNCKLEAYAFHMVESCHFYIPELRRVNCWGPAVKDLWAIFER